MGTAVPPKSTSLSLWTVYDHPSDYPHCFVARRFEMDEPTNDVITGGTLAQVRAQLGLLGVSVRLEREPGDDENIVEVWL